jgi:mono/diheme cytochrome c family protein
MSVGGRRAGIGVMLAVAGLYGYFLLFAQFAFLSLLKRAFPSDGGGEVKMILALMMAGGIAGSFLAPVLCKHRSVRSLLIWSLVVQAVLSVMASSADKIWMIFFISAAVGLSIGMATVVLAGNLGRWLDAERGCVWVGVGTGLAYGFCNLPVIFAAPADMQCLVSAGAAGVGLLGVWILPPCMPQIAELSEWMPARPVVPMRRRIPWRWMLIFCALVWLDSAAFTIIQHAPDLREGTWGFSKLWRNAGLHFAAGCIAGVWLSRGGLRSLVMVALLVIGVAGLFANEPGTRLAAGWMYPVAVSLYSTALVCWPGLLSGGEGSMRRAAWVLAVAGWVGSANGIAMAENLQRVPAWFVGIAAAVVITGLVWRRNGSGPAAAVAVGLVVGAGMLWGGGRGDEAKAAVERGRHVYISEGCIHCHSRYVRPDGADGSMWGPVSDKQKVAAESPVLIGNRRQGPDLARVGARRSAAWMREHFLHPRLIEPDSAMPEYAYLFRDGRGDDLIAFLREGAAESTGDLWLREFAWKPTDGAADKERGHVLFSRHCVACHGREGRGDGELAGRLLKRPVDLVAGPFVWTAAADRAEVPLRVARVVKFGVPGADMPGHETWDDAMVRDLAAWVAGMRAVGR